MFKELVPNFADFRRNNSMFEYHFVKKQHKMQETRNNCFGSKKRSTYQRTSNVRCCFISALVLTCFRLTKGRATSFQPETIVASFLHLMLLFYKVIFKHTSKRQFVVLHFCFWEVRALSQYYRMRMGHYVERKFELAWQCCLWTYEGTKNNLVP